MSVLSDQSIRGACKEFGLVTPWREDCIQPASYELTLDNTILVPTKSAVDHFYSVKSRGFYSINGVRDLPVSSDAIWDMEHISSGYFLQPDAICLASSSERLKIPSSMMARFEGKSTLGRAFLAVHITAGYIDPGFEGDLTLEIKNLAPWPVLLRPGDKIGQVSFHLMDSEPERLYGEAGNHYQGQNGVTPCR